MKEEVMLFLTKRPKMKEKYDFDGTFSDFIDYTIKSIKHDNQVTLLEVIADEAQRIYSKQIDIQKLKQQLRKYPLLSSADHHGLLNHKLLYNSNLLYSLIIKQLELPYVIVLTSGTISLLNKSHPRGFYFKSNKFNFFNKKSSNVPIYLFNNNITVKQKEIDSIIPDYPKNLLTSDEENFLNFLFFDFLKIQDITNDNFSDQISILNHKIWDCYFDKSVNDNYPKIIYLQSNEIINKCFIKELSNKTSIIYKILFEPEIRNLYIKNFYGIPGCWGDKSGSHFFWEVSGTKKLRPLRYEESSNSLIGSTQSFYLDKTTIIKKLSNREILPTLFFDFLIITYLQGYMALGGFNQIEYLSKMQQAHVKTLREIGMNHLANEFESRVTDALICGLMPFQFDSGIDLIWHYNSTNGIFNGNLDHGLTQDDLDRVLNMKLREMIEQGVKTMLNNL